MPTVIVNGEEISYHEFVKRLAKSGDQILAETTPEKCVLNHTAYGVCGEAGEISDVLKKHTMYGQPLDRVHLIEELGDMEWFLQLIRGTVGITREEIIQHNADKLAKRYAKLTFTNADAQARADKQ